MEDVKPNIYNRPVHIPGDLVAPHSEHGKENKTHLGQVGTNSDYVVRFMSLRECNKEVFQHRKYSNQQVLEIVKKSFSELGQMGVNMPKYQILSMKDPAGVEGIFVSAENIKSIDFQTSKEEFYRYALEMKKVWGILLRWYAAKYSSEEPFIWDIMLRRQYVWGKAASDSEARLYLVDLDPRISDTPYKLSNCLWGILNEIDSARHGVFKDLPDLNLNQYSTEIEGQIPKILSGENISQSREPRSRNWLNRLFK